jgi:protein arginine kinase
MAQNPIDLHRFASRVGSWLAPDTPDSDVVVSCRVRLARNLSDHPFVPRLEPARAKELSDRLRAHLVDLKIDGETTFVPMEEATPVLRLMLRERHLISRDLAPGDDGQVTAPGRAVAFGASESIAVMVNEEDHLRLQGLAPGFQLDKAFENVSELDRSLEKVFAAAQRTGLAVRGLHGEGSRAVGDFYQISNQITLGRAEGKLVEDLKALVPRIIDFERKVRAVLFKEQKAAVKDRVSRSIGLLRTARAMPTESALAHLSNLRLGVHLGLVNDTTVQVLNELGVQVQRGHIQAISQKSPEPELLEASERDRLRAGLLRKRLA